jgi:hypothetical protein
LSIAPRTNLTPAAAAPFRAVAALQVGRQAPALRDICGSMGPGQREARLSISHLESQRRPQRRRSELWEPGKGVGSRASEHLSSGVRTDPRDRAARGTLSMFGRFNQVRDCRMYVVPQEVQDGCDAQRQAFHVL